LWDRVHAVVHNHGERNVYDSEVAVVPEMMVAEVHTEMASQGFLEVT
jgi:hypothetical protein